ncbi:hypothetical protein GUJ93_ZPchr0009g1027 [Zizania palustris]|uniref:Prolamin-like domain-containing protein n=1 Tax=Zizania palustris TaxID=103762 RepID=A0A8J5RIL0_ZIZPA|nr:hypothetical protein GUJ93_ZPchr0009g1027 [Zizania palustris]
MANHALLSLCLFLAAGTVTAAGGGGGLRHRRLLRQSARLDLDGHPTDDATTVPPPAGGGGCWKSILASESCVKDMVESAASLHVRVGKVCCSVLEKIGDKCVLDVISSSPLKLFHLHPPSVTRSCDLAV